MKTFYSILGIDDKATLSDIKKAYRQLAIKYHPDSSKTDNNDKFIEISEAYRILSNSSYRSVYDELLQKNKKTIIYNNEDINIDLNISMYESYTGIDKEFSYKKRDGSIHSINIICGKWIQDGTVITYIGHGEHDYKDFSPGNLKIKLKIKEDKNFNIKNNYDLLTTIYVDYITASVGGIKYIDSYIPNEIIKFNIEEAVLDGDIIKSENACGLVDKIGKRGIVHGVVKLVPPKLTMKKKEALKYINSYVEPSEIIYKLCSTNKN